MTVGGGTNGADGIRTAYDLADAHFVAGGINRVVLCTDGTSCRPERCGARRRDCLYSERDIFLSVLGWAFYNDAFLEDLTNHGEGTTSTSVTRTMAAPLLKTD